MLILHHDVPSAGSLVAMLRLQRLADEGLDVDFHGYDVLGIDVALPPTLDDLEDWQAHRDRAADLGWDLPRPRRHPATLATHVVGELARAQGLDAAWRLATYRAHWIENLDLTQAEVLAGLADRAGLPAEKVQRIASDHTYRHRLRQRMLMRRSEGVGGVPVLDANGTLCSPFQPDDDLRLLAELG